MDDRVEKRVGAGNERVVRAENERWVRQALREVDERVVKHVRAVNERSGKASS